ncbi:MAG: hypothetical protein E7370_02770 [Clostridiales bacterium]|nr:hypothetical protein [Clostridiales bacterium]
MKKKNRKNLKLKPIFMAFAVMAASSVFSLAACTEPDNGGNNNGNNSATKIDQQVIKNGNFEFFTQNEDEEDGGYYYIKSANSWSKANDGSPASDVMSGIVDTSTEVWNKFASVDLVSVLDENNDLDTDDENYDELYKDFNGLESSDLPFVYTDKALAENAVDADKEFIANPYTPYYKGAPTKTGDNYFLDDGTQVYLNEEDGQYYREYNQTANTYSDIVGSNVLMLHNYTYNHKNDSGNTIHNGTAQSYKSSTSVNLVANTAAEISVWVKTSNLIYNNGDEVAQNRGAYIKLTHTVGGTELDSLYIKNINTEKLIEEGAENSNGWVKYTMYVNACDFAATTVSVTLGLGEAGKENYVEGYAFFDDLTITQVESLEDLDSYDVTATYPTATILSETDDKIFIADSLKNNSNNYDRNSKDFEYLLDLTAGDNRAKVEGSYKVGLTVDADDYRTPVADASNIQTVGNVTYVDTEDKFVTKNVTVGTSHDRLAQITVDGNKDAIKNALNLNDSYGNKIADALSTASELPGVDGSTDSLVLFSSEGAAYTANVSNSNLFTVEAESYKLVSFWVKTSDMNGSTAATLKVKDVNDEDNTGTFTVDTSSITYTLNDNDDLFNGWVQCFFFINNDTEESQEFEIDFSFGNTALKDKTIVAYKYGYAMLANMQTIEVGEEEFKLVGSNSYSAALNFSESEPGSGNKFDEVSNNLYNKINDTVAPASSYNTYYGGNNFVGIDTEEYNGLVNKKSFKENIWSDYVANGNTDGSYDWLDIIVNKTGLSTSISADQAWNEIFGNSSAQPLVITNTERYFGENQARTYGLVSKSKTLAANGYATVSFKVKVSEGAKAYIYLTNNSEDLEFNVPEYTYWYDDEGNVLKQNPELVDDEIANIAYTTSPNGLYVDKDGNFFANLKNYNRIYNDQTYKYYDENGNNVIIDNIINKQTTEVYYVDANKTQESPHFLVANDGTRLFQYVDGNYYYLENGERTEKVSQFADSYLRYTDNTSEKYLAIVDGNDASVADKWITVNFYIRGGSSSRAYTVELWNGDRNYTGLNAGEATSAEGSYILFDYSSNNATSSNYNTWLADYENDIIEYYQDALYNAGVTIASNNESIEYYETLASENGVALLDNYNYHYYTFSLYDSADYIPYNENTAGEGETDYDYDANRYNETLAYLLVNNIEEDGTYTVFADYSAIDKSIDRIVVDTDEEEDTEEVEEEVDPDATNPWLLAISIGLVAAIFVALIGYIVRIFVSKRKPSKKAEENKYNSAKKKRYIKKLKLEEVEEDDNN